MSELDKVAGEIARDLDAGNKDAVSTALSQQAASLQREEFRTLVKAVDAQEQDGRGLDLAVKVGAGGVPEHYAVLSAADNKTAKLMAQYMDEDNGSYAQALMNQVMDTVDARHAGKPEAAAQDFRLWAMAVDSYEKDGQGGDVSIDLKNPDAASIKWQMKIKSYNDASDVAMSGESLDIPVLNLGKVTREGEAVT